MIQEMFALKEAFCRKASNFQPLEKTRKKPSSPPDEKRGEIPMGLAQVVLPYTYSSAREEQYATLVSDFT